MLSYHIGNPIVEIRQSYDCLTSTVGFPILVRRHLYSESGPCRLWTSNTTCSTSQEISTHWHHHITGLVQERRNSNALKMELRLSCTNPAIWFPVKQPWKIEVNNRYTTGNSTTMKTKFNQIRSMCYGTYTWLHGWTVGSLTHRPLGDLNKILDK